MLKVYGAPWCPHCTDTANYLKQNGIAFEYLDIEKQPDSVVRQVVDANGGDDWVIPTLEFNGKWREGKVFDPEGLKADLIALGVIDA
ncbi:MAG: glutaredoxin family protein [Desulfobacterales bacterium]|nr:glutaredoxin family protein [Desulfobacterales bacterium]